VAAFPELLDAAATDVRIALDGGDVALVAPDVVQDQSFAQGHLAERHLLGAEAAEDGVEQHGAGHRQVGASRIQPRHLQAPRLIGGDERLAHFVDGLGRHGPVVQVGDDVAAVSSERDAPEAENRPRRADDALVAASDDLVDVRADRRLDVFDQPSLVAPADGVAADEPFGEADHADLEAPGEGRLARGAEGDLDAAAADVDDDAVSLREVDAVGRGDVNQPGFLGAGDHPHVDAGAIADRGEEVAAVLGLAGGAGRRRDDLVDLVRVGQAPELRQRLEAAGHRRRRQRPAVEAPGAQPDHLLLAVDDFEGLIGADLGHDHVHGVGADVDRGEAHGAP
jgi:hypothetical protein